MKIRIFFIFITLFFVINSYAKTWQGNWGSSFGQITFIEKDIKLHNAKLVFANYGKSGSIIGASFAGELHGLFYDSKDKKGGSVLFVQNENNDSFSGEWQFSGNNKRLIWNGTKINEETPENLKDVDRFRSMEGQWNSNFGLLDMVQDGVFIEAKYSDKGSIFGVYNEASKLVYGIFTNKDNYGILEFKLDEELQNFDGKWTWKTKAWEKQKWHGSRLVKE